MEDEGTQDENIEEEITEQDDVNHTTGAEDEGNHPKEKTKTLKRGFDPYGKKLFASVVVNMPADLHLTLRAPDIELLKEFPRTTATAKKANEGLWIRTPIETDLFRKCFWNKKSNQTQVQEISLLGTLNCDVRCSCGGRLKISAPTIHCFKGRIKLHQALEWYRLPCDDIEALQEGGYVDEGLIWLCALATKGWYTVAEHLKESHTNQFEQLDKTFTHVLTLPSSKEWVTSRVPKLTQVAIHFRWCNLLAGIKHDAVVAAEYLAKKQQAYEEYQKRAQEEAEREAEQQEQQQQDEEQSHAIQEEEPMDVETETKVDIKHEESKIDVTVDENGENGEPMQGASSSDPIDVDKPPKRPRIKYNKDLEKQGFPPALAQQLSKEFSTAPRRLSNRAITGMIAQLPPKPRKKKIVLNYVKKEPRDQSQMEAAMQLLDKCDIPKPEELEAKMTEIDEKIEQAIHYTNGDMTILNQKLDTDGLLDFGDFLSDGFEYDNILFDTEKGFRLKAFCKTAIKMLLSLDTMTQRITALASYVLFAFKQIYYEHKQPPQQTLFEQELYHRRISLNTLHVLFKFMCDMWNRYITFHNLVPHFQNIKPSLEIWKMNTVGTISRYHGHINATCSTPNDESSTNNGASKPTTNHTDHNNNSNNNTSRSDTMDFIRCKVVNNAQGTVWSILDVGGLLPSSDPTSDNPQINYSLLDATDTQPFYFLNMASCYMQMYFHFSPYAIPNFDWNNFRTPFSQDYYQFGIPQRWQFLSKFQPTFQKSNPTQLIQILSTETEPANPLDLFTKSNGLLGRRDIPQEPENSAVYCHQCGISLQPEEYDLCCFLCRAGRIRASHAQAWYGLSLSDLAFLDNYNWTEPSTLKKNIAKRETSIVSDDFEVEIAHTFEEATVRHVALIKARGDESQIDLGLASSRPSHPLVFLMDDCMWSCSKSTWGVVARRIEVWNATSGLTQ